MSHKTLLDSIRYKGFVADRDLALEQIHQHAQLDLSRILYQALSQVKMLASSLALKSNQSIIAAHPLSRQLEAGIDLIFGQIHSALLNRVKSMRRSVFILTYASELEAIGQATQRPKSFNNSHEFKKKLTKSVNVNTLLDQSLEARIWFDLMKLRMRLTQAFSLALIQKLGPEDVMAKLEQAIPEVQSYKRPPRALKPLREADNGQKKRDFYDYSFIDDSDWDLAAQAYKDTEIPPSRFDSSPERDPEAGYYKYNWELEQELTDDFVKQVRDGQIEAANDLGIEEFVWVAILDDRTDDCCSDRNGHTTSEIEAMLDSGELDAESCDSSSPPAHPNCRCQLAPVASTDEVKGPDWKSFQEWLDS